MKSKQIMASSGNSGNARDRRRQRRFLEVRRTASQPRPSFGFHLPLYFGWELVIGANRVPDARKHIVGPFRSYRAFISVVTTLVLVVAGVGVFITNKSIQAATYTWTQSAWNTLTGNTAVHPTNQTGWSEYSAKDTNVSAGSTVMLSPSTQSKTETSDTEFNAGTKTNTQVTGTGTGASVTLSSSEGGTPSYIQYSVIGNNYEYDSVNGAVWVVNSSTITKYASDGSSTTALATISLNPTYDTAGTVALAFDATNNVLWALGRINANLNLVKINASAGSITTSYTIESDASVVRDIRFDSSLNDLWIGYSWTSGARIIKVSPSTGSVTQTIAASAVPYEMTIDSPSAAIWYVDNASTVYKQPMDGSASTAVSLTANYSNTRHIVYDPATPAVWATSENFSLHAYHRILTSNNSVTTSSNINNPTSIAYDSAHDVMWIGSNTSSNMYKVNRTTMAVANTYALSAASQSSRIAYDPNSRALWFNNGGVQQTKRMTFLSYAASGTFNSQVLDTGGNLAFGQLTYTSTAPANTTIEIRLRTDDSPTMSGAVDWTLLSFSCGPIVSGAAAISGDHNCVDAGKRYVQYRIVMTSSTGLVSPSLSDISIQYFNYTSGTLTSSTFDANDASNVLAKLSFTQYGPTLLDTDVVTDNFERADLGNNWYDHYCGPASSCAYSHICNGSDFCGSGNAFPLNMSYYSPTQYHRDQFSEITISDVGVGRTVGAVIRKDHVESRLSYYLAETDGTTFFRLVRRSNDNETIIANLGTPYPSVGDTIRLDAFGTFIRVSVNGVLRNWLNDTSSEALYSGSAGLMAWGDTGLSTGTVESWRGGNITTNGGEIKFQLRTSANGSTWTSWMGPTGVGDYFYDPAGTQAINTQFTDGINDRYMQYRAYIVTFDNVSSPALTGVTTTYVVNAPPEFEAAPTAVQNADGTVTINYSIRDSDTGTDTGSVGLVTPSFEYSLDNGSNWSAISSGLPGSATTPKAVDSVNYTTYSAVWTAKTQLNGTYAAQAKIRVTVSDLQAANATAQSSTAAFALDVKNPVAGGTPITVNASTNPATVTLNATDDSALQMCVTLDNSVSNCIAYNTTTTITLATDPDTVYVYFVDVAGNSVSANSVTPLTPSNLVIRDISNPPTNEYQLFTTWAASSLSVPQFGSYKIYASTDGTNFSLLSTITDKTINYYLHKGLNNGDTRYYKVTTTDASGNVSYFSPVISGIANGQGGGTDLTPPAISAVTATSITTQSAIITWDTDELSNSTVGYSTTAAVFTTEVGVATMLDNATGVGRHSVTLNNLTPGATYFYRVKSMDPSGNFTFDTHGGDGYTFTTLTGPTISNVTTTSVDNTTATITWQTNIAADSAVRYSTSATLASPTTVTVANPITTHTVTLTGLIAGTKYYFEVASGVALDPNGGNYFTFTTTHDVDPPTISSIIIAPITDTQAVIVWATNERATGQVSYGTTAGVHPFTSSTVTTFNVDHAITLSGLSPNTTYTFVITSADSSGNSTTSVEQTFTTLDDLLTSAEAQALIDAATAAATDTTAPALSGIEVTDITATSANVNWSSDESANSFVKFGPTTADQVIYGNWVYSQTHSIPLLTLTANTAYTYVVVSADLHGNITTSPAATFTTAVISAGALEDQLQAQIENITQSAEGLPGPTISGQPAVQVTPTSATITWTTDKPATSLISYATSGEYTPRKVYTQTVGDPDTFVTNHSVKIGNLSADTDYHYQIKSASAVFQTSITADAVFHTPKLTFAIDNYSIDTPTTTTAVFRWTTNDTASASVLVTPYRDNVLAVDEQISDVDDTRSFIHQISLDSLEPGIRYQVEMISVNTVGNRTSRLVPTFSTASTGQPPAISQIRIDSALSPGEKVKVQTIVSWNTDISSTSRVLYRAGVGRADEELPASTTLDASYTKHHVVVITSFEPGTVYQLRVESKDSNGQTATSKALTTLTPQQERTVFQVITNTFQQVFGWTKVFNR